MTDSDTNPYAPPAVDLRATSPPMDFASESYRIEKNVMILRRPFVLPEVCFLTGARQGLRRCEIPLRVMPKWWNYVMPMIMISTQMVVMFSSIAIQKLQVTSPPWFVPPLAGVLLGVIAPAVIVAGFLLVAQKVTLTGFLESSETVFLRRRRSITRVLIFDVILGVIIVLARLILPHAFLLTALALVSVAMAFLVTLVVWQKNRKPWSRIGALQQADGSLAVHGLDPAFLAVCRLGLDNPTHLMP